MATERKSRAKKTLRGGPTEGTSLCDEQNSKLGDYLTCDLLNSMQLLNCSAAWGVGSQVRTQPLGCSSSAGA